MQRNEWINEDATIAKKEKNWLHEIGSKRKKNMQRKRVYIIRWLTDMNPKYEAKLKSVDIHS